MGRKVLVVMSLCCGIGGDSGDDSCDSGRADDGDGRDVVMMMVVVTVMEYK